jgi:tripartite-type tricarboxylate transporter receptor subunit TctC
MNRFGTWLALILAVLASPIPANAVEAPNCTIKVVVTGPAGGTPDLIARVGAEKLRVGIDRNVVVENKVGGLGAAPSIVEVRNAAADGCTLLAANASIFSIAPSLYKTPPYDPKDFVPISLLAISPNVLLVNASVPAKTLDEFVALVRKDSGKLNFGSGGVGTPMHLYGALLQTKFGLVFPHVPYRGSAPVMTDLISNQVQFVFEQIPSFIAHQKSGAVRALAVANATRSPLLPDVPTFAELGVSGADAVSWFGLVAPSRTPPEIIELYSKALRDGMKDPQVRDRLAQVGAEAVGTTPAETAAYLEGQREKWIPLVAASGVKVD